MRLFLPLLLLTACATAQVGCEHRIGEIARSGSPTDDFVEQPIDDAWSRFQPALATSNDIVRACIGGEFEHVHATWFSDSLKASLPVESLRECFSSALGSDSAGATMKPGQWCFTLAEFESRPTVYSSKIIEHAGRRVRCTVSFDERGDQRVVTSLRVRAYAGVPSVMDLR